MNELMPAFFIGHGNPMNALSKNSYTEGWGAMGRSIPRPRAILCVSAHWYISGCSVTADTHPRTIHDFGGFPEELYGVEYPAPGSPELALRVKELLMPVSVALDTSWGLDHGAWSVLTHLFPASDIPVVQLSIDKREPPAFHYELGKQLGPLREEGILIIGSGNLVHNLQVYGWGRGGAEPFDWGVRFENLVRGLIDRGEDTGLFPYESLSDGMLSVPTPDHFLPLLYPLGLRRDNEKVSYPVQGFDGGSISMLSVRVG